VKGFTTPEDLMAHGWDYLRVPGDKVQRVVTLRTSGSTGPAKKLYFTAGDLERTIEYFRTGMAWISRPGDRVAVCMGSLSPDGLGRLLEEGLRRLGAEPMLLGFVKNYDETAAALRELRPDTVVGLPVQVRRLALLAPGLRPRTVLLSGDYVSLAVRDTVARIWETKVFDHYGLTESGLGFAVQCPELLGMHIREDELQVEIVEPGSGRVLPEGEWGEIVFTTLRREAMPLRRYRTGDWGRLLPGTCPCGRPGPRLDRVLGRITERSKPISIYTLDEILLREDGIRDYAAALEGDRLRVTLDLAPGLTPEEIGSRLADLWPPERLCPEAGAVPPGTAKRSVEICG
jgi:phenylacetate-coenzyme A ligase PaaK-like adenylate-forming protein